ncbi:extracellular solute-binding protein [Phytoactinopolyspora mesophila]|uniref:Extracellular solute-binding protein n=1 Tax=Phytoactinopolyspora mesophila TaxID=2650750 RepID=A0A7K3M1P8_9ACTN|nr:extracellular solute-binding protein [Phytoactinopolyspora mesophila]NDL57199.1 extracellular solute-binding protein [Phytoactinopolyspora mesophila]
MSRPNTLSRRGFLGMSGSLGIAAAFGLSSCGNNSGSGSSGGGGGGTVTAILPSTTPTGWNAVLERVNEKLEADTGLTLRAEFINWSSYQEQTLLKFTAGESFDNALQALWLNMAQLQQDGALADLTDQLDNYENLSATLDSRLIESNSWDGQLWGIPQANSAGRCQHFAVRQDLADELGFSEITDYETLERFFYAVKEKDDGTIPFGAGSGSGYLNVMPVPAGMLNAASWEDPHTIARAFTGRGMYFVFARDAAETGSSRPVPFWEDEGALDALYRIRQYYEDGLINKDAINSDSDTIKSQWTAGKYAATWAMTDGLTSNDMPALTRSVPGAMLANVIPYTGGLGALPNQTFQADNLVVVNANGGNVENALTLQDWVSIQENHDLIEYGIEGTDWQPVGEDKFESLSDYEFPGYALCWRASLQRKSSYMTESEERVFSWAQDFDNFTVDPFASFIPQTEPVGREISAMESVISEFANPLYYGVVDVDDQLDKLKRAAENAGLNKLQAEMEKQADEHLSKNA